MSEDVLMRRLVEFVKENLDDLQALGDKWIEEEALTVVPEEVETAYTGHTMGKITAKLPVNWIRMLPLPYLVATLLFIKKGVQKYKEYLDQWDFMV